jgi:hypothetical protein
MPNKEAPTKQPGELGALEFEFTDLTTARKSLEEPPPGIEERKYLESGYWEERRRKQLPSDRALTGMTIDWMLALPDPVRPQHLCQAFPRVANTLSETWLDRSRATTSVERLLKDDRGGTRRGFPDDVKSDLTVLYRYLQGLQRS